MTGNESSDDKPIGEPRQLSAMDAEAAEALLFLSNSKQSLLKFAIHNSMNKTTSSAIPSPSVGASTNEASTNSLTDQALEAIEAARQLASTLEADDFSAPISDSEDIDSGISPTIAQSKKNGSFSISKQREQDAREKYSLTEVKWIYTAVGTSKCSICSHKAKQGTFCCSICGFRVCLQCLEKPNSTEHTCLGLILKSTSPSTTDDSDKSEESAFSTEGWVSTARKQPPKPPKQPRKKSAKQMAKEALNENLMHTRHILPLRTAPASAFMPRNSLEQQRLLEAANKVAEQASQVLALRTVPASAMPTYETTVMPHINLEQQHTMMQPNIYLAQQHALTQPRINLEQEYAMGQPSDQISSEEGFWPVLDTTKESSSPPPAKRPRLEESQ